MRDSATSISARTETFGGGDGSSLDDRGIFEDGHMSTAPSGADRGSISQDQHAERIHASQQLRR